ncbi:MAG: fused MFS/spermidine synthase [Gemmatimonadota bacterium]|nr:fused MFS/spermidine synthase [Gemmatimonadota bacterium]MDH3421384.1 fused MFS/spermidine synthase [Gemmatimonadota bacterium]
MAFASGFAVLTIEIAGARLIAPVFGLSAVPWTAVIGVILMALAVGSHLGGRLADSGAVPLSTVLAIAGLTGALPVLGGGFPWMARDVLGFIPGAIVSAMVLFAPPVLCLGAVVPYLVQADTESLGTVGRRAGDVSAAATGGSIAGTFATGFVLLPAFSLPVLLGLTSAGLLLMAVFSGRILGRGPGEGRLLVGALALGALGYTAAQPGSGTLHAQQTLYSAVQVTEREWADGRLVREMFQNGGSSSAEYVDTGEPAHEYVVASQRLLEPVIDAAGSMLVLGGAALTLPVAFQHRRPELQITVVEIDPVVTDLARRYFAYGDRSYPDIEIVHEDARVYLRSSQERFDFVYLDVFDHLLTVPWTLVTSEALSDMAARLGPNGLFVANVLSPLAGPGVGFLEYFRATLERTFADVHIYLTDTEADPVVTQNLIVVASPKAGGAPTADWANEAEVTAAGRVLTDSWAPVEYLQAKVFLRGLGWR